MHTLQFRPTPGPDFDPYRLTPPILDRLADIELQHGHHGAAERLAERAAILREGAQ